MFTSKLPQSTAGARTSLHNNKERHVDAAGGKAVGEMLRYVAEVEGRVKSAVEDSARRTEKLKAEEQAQREILASLKREIVLVQQLRKREADELEGYVRQTESQREKLKEELSTLQQQVRSTQEKAAKASAAFHREQQERKEHLASYRQQATHLTDDIRQLTALKKNAEMDLLLVEQLLCEATHSIVTLNKEMTTVSRGNAQKEKEKDASIEALVSNKVAELAEELQETDSLATRYLSSMKHQEQQQRATLCKMEEKVLAKKDELTALQCKAQEMKKELAFYTAERDQWCQACFALKGDASRLQQVKDVLLSDVQDLARQRQALLVDNEASGRGALSNVEDVIFQALQKSFRYREVFVELEEVKHSLLEAVDSLAEEKQDVERDFRDTEAALATKRNILRMHHDILSAQDEKVARAIERSKSKETEVLSFVHELDRQMRDAQALAMAEAIHEATHTAPPHESE